MARLFDSMSSLALVSAVTADRDRDDLYIGTATQPGALPRGQRGGNKTVVQTSMFFADIDFANDKTSDKAYPPDEETALELLGAFAHRPTFIQRSGGGLHVIWLWAERLVCDTDADRKRAAGRSKRCQRELREHFKMHGFEIDAVGDLARVYCFPLSFNHKYGDPRLVEVIHWNPDTRVDAAQLDDDDCSLSAVRLPSSGPRPRGSRRLAIR